MVLDDCTILTGAVEFAIDSDQVTGDHLWLIHDPELAHRYTQTWQDHRTHSTRYRKPLVTAKELAWDVLGIVLYGSGLFFWPLRGLVARRVRRRGKALLSLFILQVVLYMLMAFLAFTAIVRLEHGYYWLIIALPLNGLFTIAAIVAWVCDALWDRRASECG